MSSFTFVSLLVLLLPSLSFQSAPKGYASLKDCRDLALRGMRTVVAELETAPAISEPSYDPYSSGPRQDSESLFSHLPRRSPSPTRRSSSSCQLDKKRKRSLDDTTGLSSNKIPRRDTLTAQTKDDEEFGVTYYNPTSSSIFYEDDELLEDEAELKETVTEARENMFLERDQYQIANDDYDPNVCEEETEYSYSAVPKRAEGYGRTENVNSYSYYCQHYSFSRIVVFNLSELTHVVDLETQYGHFGEIRDLWFVKSSRFRSQLYAFIEYHDRDSARDAVEAMQITRFIGRTICTDYAPKVYDPSPRHLHIRAPDFRENEKFTKDYIDEVFRMENFSRLFGHPAYATYDHRKSYGRVLFPTVTRAERAVAKFRELGFITSDFKNPTHHANCST